MFDGRAKGWRQGTLRTCWSRMLALLPALAAGCISDGTLLDENSAVALRTVRTQARQDLSCPAATVSIVSEKEVPGAPWGYLYSDYRVRAEGCGRGAFYDVECRDETLCDLKNVQP
ncbi:hypothetical protein ACW73L_08540 [Methylolobus aquaticus]